MFELSKINSQSRVCKKCVCEAVRGCSISMCCTYKSHTKLTRSRHALFSFFPANFISSPPFSPSLTHFHLTPSFFFFSFLRMSALRLQMFYFLILLLHHTKVEKSCTAFTDYKQWYRGERFNKWPPIEERTKHVRIDEVSYSGVLQQRSLHSIYSAPNSSLEKFPFSFTRSIFCHYLYLWQLETFR